MGMKQPIPLRWVVQRNKTASASAAAAVDDDAILCQQVPPVGGGGGGRWLELDPGLKAPLGFSKFDCEKGWGYSNSAAFNSNLCFLSLRH